VLEKVGSVCWQSAHPTVALPSFTQIDKGFPDVFGKGAVVFPSGIDGREKIWLTTGIHGFGWV